MILFDEMIVSDNATKILADEIKLNYPPGQIVLICGKTYSKNILNSLDLNQFERFEVTQGSTKEITKFNNQFKAKNISTIVAVGGGKVLDFSKRLSFKRSLYLICAPTVISNDGLCSPIAVLKGEDGITYSLKGKSPDAIYIDLAHILSAPKKYLISAQADLLTNLSACNDWIIASNKGYDKISSYAYFIAKQSALDVLLFDTSLDSRTLIKRLIHCQILSGQAMLIAGTSRPCSGSEHLLSHAIDYLKYGKNILHGHQVGSLSLFTLYLQNDLRPKYLLKAQTLGINLDWTTNLKEVSDDILKKIFSTSKIMRTNRYTVLDTLDENIFIEKVNDFRKAIKIFIKS